MSYNSVLEEFIAPPVDIVRLVTRRDGKTWTVRLHTELLPRSVNYLYSAYIGDAESSGGEALVLQLISVPTDDDLLRAIAYYNEKGGRAP